MPDLTARMSRHFQPNAVVPLSEANLSRHTLQSPPSREEKLRHILVYIDLQRQLIAFDRLCCRSASDLHRGPLDDDVAGAHLWPSCNPITNVDNGRPSYMHHRRTQSDLSILLHNAPSSPQSPSHHPNQTQPGRTASPRGQAALYGVGAADLRPGTSLLATPPIQSPLQPSRQQRHPLHYPRHHPLYQPPPSQPQHQDLSWHSYQCHAPVRGFDTPDALDPRVALPRALPRPGPMISHPPAPEQPRRRDSFCSGYSLERNEKDFRTSPPIEDQMPDSPTIPGRYGGPRDVDPHRTIQSPSINNNNNNNNTSNGNNNNNNNINTYRRQDTMDWSDERRQWPLQLNSPIMTGRATPGRDRDRHGEAVVTFQNQPQMPSPRGDSPHDKKRPGRFSRFSFLTRNRSTRRDSVVISAAATTKPLVIGEPSTVTIRAVMPAMTFHGHGAGMEAIPNSSTHVIHRQPSQAFSISHRGADAASPVPAASPIPASSPVPPAIPQSIEATTPQPGVERQEKRQSSKGRFQQIFHGIFGTKPKQGSIVGPITAPSTVTLSPSASPVGITNNNNSSSSALRARSPRLDAGDILGSLDHHSPLAGGVNRPFELSIGKNIKEARQQQQQQQQEQQQQQQQRSSPSSPLAGPAGSPAPLFGARESAIDPLQGQIQPRNQPSPVPPVPSRPLMTSTSPPLLPHHHRHYQNDSPTRATRTETEDDMEFEELHYQLSVPCAAPTALTPPPPSSLVRHSTMASLHSPPLAPRTPHALLPYQQRQQQQQQQQQPSFFNTPPDPNELDMASGYSNGTSGSPGRGLSPRQKTRPSSQLLPITTGLKELCLEDVGLAAAVAGGGVGGSTFATGGKMNETPQQQQQQLRKQEPISTQVAIAPQRTMVALSPVQAADLEGVGLRMSTFIATADVA